MAGERKRSRAVSSARDASQLARLSPASPGTPLLFYCPAEDAGKGGGEREEDRAVTRVVLRAEEGGEAGQ